MKITLDIPEETIAGLFRSAIEGGDPVTTASRGGWCVAIELATPMLKEQRGGKSWYDQEKTFSHPALRIAITELDDEITGHETVHKFNLKGIQKGLTIMAQKFPHLFGKVIRDEVDAPCADIFLQCILFGTEKYA